MPRRLTIEERVFIVKHFYMTQSARETARLFEDNYGRSIDRKSIPDLIRRFEETGSVAETKHGAPRPQAEEDTTAVVGAMGDLGDDFSVRKAAQQLEFSKSTVHRILKKDLQLKCYRYSLHQELNGDDPDRRLEFCENFIMNNDAENIIDRIVWTDEANFRLDGVVNRHNQVYWAERNEHHLQTKSMNKQAVTVWGGISSEGVIGPYFFNERVNGNNYLNMLREIVPELNENTIWMQDGAPAHYHRQVVEYLNSVFPNRWIGRRGSYLEWPPRSPDLTPPDFFLWGYIKDTVFKTYPRTIDDLKIRIREAFLAVPQMLCHKVCHTEVLRRLNLCVHEGGNHIENLK